MRAAPEQADARRAVRPGRTHEKTRPPGGAHSPFSERVVYGRFPERL